MVKEKRGDRGRPGEQGGGKRPEKRKSTKGRNVEELSRHFYLIRPQGRGDIHSVSPRNIYRERDEHKTRDSGPTSNYLIRGGYSYWERGDEKVF